MHPSRRPLLAVLLGAVVLALVVLDAGGPRAGSAKAAASCPKPGSTLASADGVRAWVTKRRLRVCVDRGQTVRIRDYGPWTGGRIRLDAESVVWTTRTKRGGRTVERLWAREHGAARRWMGGLRAVPSGKVRDERLRGLELGEEEAEGDTAAAAAWVTRSGAVVLAHSASVEVAGDEPRELVERLPEDQVASVAKTLSIGTRTTVDESCVSSTTNVLTARRSPDGPEEVLAEGEPMAGDDPPGDTTCTPTTYR